MDNSRVAVRVEVYRPEAAAVWITDTETGDEFGVRFNDLEAVTTLCVHAEDMSTIGNCQPDEGGK